MRAAYFLFSAASDKDAPKSSDTYVDRPTPTIWQSMRQGGNFIKPYWAAKGEPWINWTLDSAVLFRARDKERKKKPSRKSVFQTLKTLKDLNINTIMLGIIFAPYAILTCQYYFPPPSSNGPVIPPVPSTLEDGRKKWALPDDIVSASVNNNWKKWTYLRGAATLAVGKSRKKWPLPGITLTLGKKWKKGTPGNAAPLASEDGWEKRDFFRNIFSLTVNNDWRKSGITG